MKRQIVAVSLLTASVFAADGNLKLVLDRAARSASGQRSGYISSFDDTIPHIAFGESWTTTFTIMNFRSTSVTIPLAFSDDSGKPMMVPVVGAGTKSALTLTIPANGTTVLATQYVPGQPLSSGMARLDIPCDSTCGGVGGFAIFHWKNPGRTDQEAAVPLTSSLENKTVIGFDNRNGYVTGVALSLPRFTEFDTGTADILVVARDGNGNRLVLDQIRLNVNGHTAFVLTDKYPVLTGAYGTIEFSHDSQSVAAIGLLFNPQGAYSTTPSYQP
jgi:hypothetical protein